MIVVDGNETKYYYHFDGLGSVVALSDVNNTIVERYSYDVFGEPNRTSDVNNPYFFTGRRYDSEFGLYYYRARYYKPYIGRFIHTDPIRYAAGLNLYTYCGNNPIIWVDPYGFKRSVWDFCRDLSSYLRDNPDFFSDAGQQIGQAALDGATIAANAYTFGLIDPLDRQASEKVSEYGNWGKASEIFAGISRDAAIAAAGTKAFELSTRSLSTTWRVASGADGGSCMYMRYTSKLTGRTIRYTQYAWDGGGKFVHQHIKYIKFLPW